MKLITLIQFAGLLHVGLLIAGALMPRVVGFNTHLAVLPPFLRRLFRVYLGFIAGMIVAFGSISFFLAEQLAAGGPAAGALLLVMTVFWTARFLVALLVFDMSPYLTTRWRRWGYHVLNLTFLYLPIVYGYTFWKGVS